MHTYPQALMEGDEQMSGNVNHQPEYDEAQTYFNSAPDSRPHREKFNSLLILSIGFFAVIAGGITMWINIANPFESIIKAGQSQNAAYAAAQQADILAQQTKDTDGDGLTDYDEVNKYSTSPYLKDSDGDGIDDKTEVLRGTDPNCPEGQSCFSGTANSAATSSVGSLQTTLGNLTIDITPAYIRQIMKANGATDAQVAALTDDQLMTEFKSYLAANPSVAADLANQGINVNVSGNQSTTTLDQPNVGNIDLKALNVSSVDDLQKLTGAQIRQLMISSGASATVLAQVTDDDLKTLFLKQVAANSAAAPK